MPARSGQIAFSGKLNKPWFGFDTYNAGGDIPARTLIPWHYNLNMSSLTCHLWPIASANNRKRLLGYAPEAIAGEVKGFIAAGGYDQIRVHGSVAVDDFLRMAASAPHPGCAEATTVIDIGEAFAIAKESNATDTTNNIRAIVFPWRL